MKFLYLIFLILFSSILNNSLISQIYYQDIEPDVIINTWSMHDININSKFTDSLNYGDPGNLTIWNDFGSQIDINAFSDCEIIFYNTYPAALNKDDTISSSSNWSKPDYSLLNNGTVGNWIGVSDKYLGVRIKSGANWLYGWIRLDVNTAGSSVTIKDYACNRTPNEVIYAGHYSPSDIQDNNLYKNLILNIYPNPVINELFIDFNSNNFESINIEILNSLGISVLNSNINNQNFGIGSYRINLGDLESGIYFCLIKTNNISKSLKFIINK